MKRVSLLPNGEHLIKFDVTLVPYRKLPVIVFGAQMDEEFEVETLEGEMRGTAGDYLIRGVAGEFYIVRKDIFALTFEQGK